MKVKLEASTRHHHHPHLQQQQQQQQPPLTLLTQESNDQFITPLLARQHQFRNNHNNHEETLLGAMGAAIPPLAPPVQSGYHRRDSVSLSDYYSDNEPNDNLDFNELTRIAQYRQAIEIIKRKCETLSKDNEKLVGRLHHIKKITKHKEKDVLLLKTRLDQYNDGWRTAQPDNQAKEQQRSLIPQTNKILKKTKMGKKEKMLAAGSGGSGVIGTASRSGDSTTLSTIQNQQPINNAIIATPTPAPAITTTTSSTPPSIITPCSTKKSVKVSQQQQSLLLQQQQPSPNLPTQKRKRAKTEREKDPNAPKRPANAFFQFCQEKRSNLMDELNSELKPGEPELSKQELTRQLANRWRSMDSDSKKVYINKYENSKQKYNEEMQCYRENVNSGTIGGGAGTTNDKTISTSLEFSGLVPSFDGDAKRLNA